MKTEENYREAHRPVSLEKVKEQLESLYVGQLGVAGLVGSYSHCKRMSKGVVYGDKKGECTGPGVVVKRLGEDKFQVGNLDAVLNSTEASQYIFSYYFRG